MMESLVAATLNPAQQKALEHYRALNLTATWAIGTPTESGTVTVVALGDTFVWEFEISADGTCDDYEVLFEEDEGWSRGITC